MARVLQVTSGRPAAVGASEAGLSPPPWVLGRAEECRRIQEYVNCLPIDPGSLILVGEAGIGKTTLWNHAVATCRAAGAQVLVTRPSQEDRHNPGQGLLDLFDPRRLREPATTDLFDPALTPPDRSRAVLELLGALTAHGPVVVGVDDLPWLDDVTWRALRFALRRLGGEPVALLATARTWSPHTMGTPVPDLDDGVHVLEVPRLAARELRRLVLRAVPNLTPPLATRISDLAHGNPFFALELARSHSGDGAITRPGRPMTALAIRVAELGPATLHLAQLLAVAGPSPLRVLAAASGGGEPADALRPGLAAEIFNLTDDFVLRFAHPLISTAVLGATNTLDRQRLHAALALALDDPDARSFHLARSVVGPDAEVAEQIEHAALRLARHSAPRLAAELLADSARLTPAGDDSARGRRTLAQMMQCATAGDLPTALRLATRMLQTLPPGPGRAAVVTGRVVLDFTGAEDFLRAALDEVPGDGEAAHECLRGRLLGLLGWLVGLHLGRLAEGLGYAQAGLELGRAQGDQVLVAQAAAAVSTISLLAGRRCDDLIDEALGQDGEVVQSQLILWPGVLKGRQQLWDGHLAEARINFEATHRRAVANGTEIQLCYRLYDLALAEVAAGDLVQGSQHAEEGMEAASDCEDERAISWLAYPAGLVAALRGDATAAQRSADRLCWWADQVGERPRAAMAAHVRGVLAAAAEDWETGLGHLMAGLSILENLGWQHPGAIPMLPLAIQLAAMAELPDRVESLNSVLRRRCAALASPWADAQLSAATGQLRLLRDEPDAFAYLVSARERLSRLGHGLDAARLGCFVTAAGLRFGQRRQVLPVVESSLQAFRRNGVRGWDSVAEELAGRARRTSDCGLTATEGQIARLVATGHRNREVAGRLFVSESTVEAHLTRIYRKLGLRNRTELVRQVDRLAG